MIDTRQYELLPDQRWFAVETPWNFCAVFPEPNLEEGYVSLAGPFSTADAGREWLRKNRPQTKQKRQNTPARLEFLRAQAARMREAKKGAASNAHIET